MLNIIVELSGGTPGGFTSWHDVVVVDVDSIEDCTFKDAIIEAYTGSGSAKWHEKEKNVGNVYPAHEITSYPCLISGRVIVEVV